MKLEKYDYQIKHIPEKDNVIANTLSRINKLTTRADSEKTKTVFRLFEHRSFQNASRIAILSSPDKIQDNCLLPVTIQLNITEKGEIERMKTSHKIIYVVYYRAHAKKIFDPFFFNEILTTLKDLMIQHKENEIGMIDEFNSISCFQLLTTERQIASTMSPITVYWITQGKLPKDKIAFLTRRHTNPILAYPSRVKLNDFLTTKGYYWLGMKQDIAEIINTCEFCQLHKRDTQIWRPPMCTSDTPLSSFEKISIYIVDMRTM